MCKGDESSERIRRLVEFLISDNSVYQYHKETMAHACVVLEIVLFAWIMTEDGWKVIEYAGFFTWIIIIITWFLLHLYLRWELRLRRWSAILIDGLYETYGKWAIANPTEDELQIYKKPDKKTDDRLNRLLKNLDFLIPYFPGSITFEELPSGYPIAIINTLKKAESDKKRNRRLKFGEWLPSGFSLLIILVVVIRRLMDC